MNQPMQFLWSLPKPALVGIALSLILLTGYVDYVTGHDLALTAFYLGPICLAAWSMGRRIGTMMAMAGALTWLIAELASGYIYPNPLVAYWNAIMLLGLFLAVVYSLTAFHTAYHSLEETVQQRTAALQALEVESRERRRMEAAKLRAERFAVVGQMASQVAHEVRNPLGSITLNLDLTHKEIDKLAGGNGHLPDEGRTLVKEMREEVCRIGRVIEDYLQFARLPKLQRQPMDLNAFLEQKLGFLWAELEQAKVKLVTRFGPAPLTINADADQLWQAMMNLIRNSREAMPYGGELIISAWRDGGQVFLRVSDDGQGMTEEQRQQVFAPFFTTKGKGNGLGLALVHQIIAENGGRIECESVLGKGCTFTIYFPVAEKT